MSEEDHGQIVYENGATASVETAGYIVNQCVCQWGIMLNMMLVLYSKTPLDAVLNVVAVMFITDIDNMMVKPRHYTTILEWINDDKNVAAITSTPISAARRKLLIYFCIARGCGTMLYMLATFGLGLYHLVIAPIMHC